LSRRSKVQKEEDLCSLIDSELSRSVGADASELSDQRSKAMEYYLGEPYGNEMEGQSQVRTREVLDTIEWIKPELMKIFASGTETVRFEPEGPDDVEGAQQATDYINYLFNRKNPGFKILYQWVTDGLLQKNGVVKAWWDDSRNKVRESYNGLTEVEVSMLTAPDNVEVIDFTPVDNAGEQPLFDVTILVTGPQRGLQIEVIPPEEFIISKGAKSIGGSPFCAHVSEKTISDLRTMGYSKAETEDLQSSSVIISVDSPERQARYANDDTDSDESDSKDDTMRKVLYEECYVRTDFDGDGIAELRKVCKVGKDILANDEVDCMPFAGWTPIIISHKWSGLSIADLVMDLQLIQSQLLRNILNNQYLTNNGRYAAIDGMVNMDDLLSSRAHGVVRMKMAGAVQRLDTPQLGQSAFQMLEYMDRLREKRTGVSERSQGLDPRSLGANQAASAVNQVMTAAQQRIELIARVFGETGLTDLFHLMYKLVLQNDTSKSIFRLRDVYVEVNPSDWRERSDSSVVVGLGNGSKESELMQLGVIFQQQQQLSQNPAFSSLVSRKNVYSTVEDMVKVVNKANAGRYFSNPDSQEAKAYQQKNDQAAQQQQAMAAKMAEMEQQLKAKEIEIDQLKAQADAKYKDRMAAVAEGKLQTDTKLGEDKLALGRAELELEYELEKTQGRGVELG